MPTIYDYTEENSDRTPEPAPYDPMYYTDSPTFSENLNLTNSPFRHPVKLTWNDTYFVDENTGVLKDETHISTEIMQQLRQHAKAIINNFNVPTTYRWVGHGPQPEDAPTAVSMPSFDKVEDGYLVDQITNEELNEIDGSVNPSYSGLLDDMDEGNIEGLNDYDPLPGGVFTGIKITKDKINEIAARLQDAANYQNYSNHANTRADEYMDLYLDHGRSHSNSTRGLFCHRHHGNHSNTGNEYANHQKSVGTYSDSPTDHYDTTRPDGTEHTDNIGPRYVNSGYNNYIDDIT